MIRSMVRFMMRAPIVGGRVWLLVMHCIAAPSIDHERHAPITPADTITSPRCLPGPNRTQPLLLLLLDRSSSHTQRRSTPIPLTLTLTSSTIDVRLTCRADREAGISMYCICITLQQIARTGPSAFISMLPSQGNPEIVARSGSIALQCPLRVDIGISSA